MRPITRVISSIALIAVPAGVLAHGAEELGHHWDVPAYRAEMRLQIVLMIAVCLVAIAARWVLGACRRRRARQ